MEFITNKAKVAIPNYYIDAINDLIIFYSKTNNKFQIQFNKYEMAEFIDELNKRYSHLSVSDYEDLEKQVEDLEEKINDYEDEQEEYECEIRELQREIKNLHSKYKSVRGKINDLLEYLPHDDS